MIVTIIGTYIYASNCGCDELEIKKLQDEIAFLEEENERLRVECKSQIDQLEINLQNVNTELSIINPQLLNTIMNYSTCLEQQQYFRLQYKTEKTEKEMYRNRVDNMTEEMNRLRLEHRDQLHSKIQRLTTCENNIRICEDFHLKHCTETVTRLTINYKECEENYNTCLVQQEYLRQQYETEKKEKEMYSNNMTEEVYRLRLEHHDQLHSKIQDLTRCENNIRICEDFHLKHCTEIVTQLNINDEECKERLKKYSVKLAQCEMNGNYTASDLSRCQRNYNECSDELDKYKRQRCYGFRM